jgi:small subunit ribosomal protein S1
MTDVQSFTPSRDDFSAMLDESFGGRDFAEGTVVQGIVVGVDRDFVIVDVGLKTEGRISTKEFGPNTDGQFPVKVGETVEVFLDRIENAMGEAVISREKARREEAWTRLEVVFADNLPVMGTIVGRVKGGFTVDLGGASAFLPARRWTSARCATSVP